MPNPTMTGGAGSAATVTQPNGDAAPVAIPSVPFVRASFQHTEPANLDESRTLTASAQQIGPVDVPAYGYMRHLLLLVEATGGTGAVAVATADAPFNAVAEVTLHDVNGAPIITPVTGYDAYLVHRWGGYAFNDDPRNARAFQGVQTNGNYSFLLRIPVEIGDRDGLGALPNMNASSTYKLRVTLAPNTTVYSTQPTTQPTVRVRAWLEAWAPPSARSDLGDVQAIQPPALGTTQMWSKTQDDIANGFNTIRFTRVGNFFRNLILVFRNPSNARTDTGLPDSLQWFVDGRLLSNEALTIRRHYMVERYQNRTVQDDGVIVYDWAHDFDGKVGGEMRDQYMRSATSTRFELQATFTAAGNLEILTNDIAPDGDIFLP